MTRKLFQTLIIFNRQYLMYTGLCITIAFTLLSQHVIADDYLDALHDEAGKLEYLDETRSSNAISTRKKNISREIQQALNSISNFEKYFKTTDSATAAIYFRLTTQERLRIFHRFKSSKDFNLAKKMTIELFNQKQ